MEKREKVIIGVSIISIVAIIYIIIAADFIEDEITFMEKYGYMMTFDDPDETKARKELKTTYKKIYKDVWKYNYLGIIDEEHDYAFDINYDEREIEAVFILKDEYGEFDDNVMESMPEICNAVKTVVNKYFGDEYSLYPIRILFGEADYDSYDESLITIEYTDDAQIMKISIEDSNVTLSKIVEVFPDVNEIEADGLHYDSMDEINGFDNLQSIKVLNSNYSFTEEEKEYILSLYPDCKIYDSEGE